MLVDGRCSVSDACPKGQGFYYRAILADGLAEIPADRTSLDAGEQVVVHLLKEMA